MNTDEMRKEAKRDFAEYTRMGQRLLSALDEIDRLRKVCETRRELCKLEKLGG